MKKIFPLHAADFYKTGHLRMYPAGTDSVYSNFTPRSAHHAPFEWQPGERQAVVNFGLQGVIQWMLIDLWNDEFFKKPKDQVIARFKRRMDTSLGEGAVDTTHIAALHDLGYLPLIIKALPEGALVDIGVPLFTVINNDPRFYWLTNYIETQLSCELWKSTVSATIAFQYRKLLEDFAEQTGSPMAFVDWQGHDFSMRGMSGIHDAASTGGGHLLSFLGTDTICALDYLEDFYLASDTFIGGSVPATEHSVMCMGGKESEIETYRRLIEDLYPSGVVSIVSDTWDLWKVLTEYTPALKDKILARKPDANGLAKVVFRPDSGDPYKILVGDMDAPVDSPAFKGAVECLWDVFGGTMTNEDYQVLDSHVGLIYGESINLKTARRILQGLKDKGFASCNVVFGIGSFTYQYVTRDTFSMAYKTTWGVVNGEEREVMKDPITDNGSKRSAKGLLRVSFEGGRYVLHDQQTPGQETLGFLRPVFHNGQALNQQSLTTIRERLRSQR